MTKKLVEFWLTKGNYVFTDKDLSPEKSVAIEEVCHVIEKKAYDNLKAGMKSWEVNREIEIYANSDKEWNKLIEENKILKDRVATLEQDVEGLRNENI